MKKVWKWILGILIVVLVLGAVGAAAWAWQRNGSLAFMPGSAPSEKASMPHTPAGPPGPRGGPSLGPGFERSPGPLMDRPGGPPRMPFGGGFFLPGGLLWMRLIPFALTILILAAAYQLGKRAGILSMTTRGTGLQTEPTSK